MTPVTNSGNAFEQTVEGIFRSKKYNVLRYSEWEANPTKFGTELLLKGAPYKTIYDHNGRTEFLIRSKIKNLNTRVEMKWQQSNGSVDEKLPYLYLNAIFTMPEEHIVIVIDGPGFKKGAISWLRRVVKQKEFAPPGFSKRIDVLSIVEFLTWANVDC